MTSRCALYVDVGYLLASAATRVTGTSLRNGVVVDYGRLIDALVAQAEAASGLPLLRVHWYDSGGRPGGQADSTQETIGMLPRVKLRLGRLSYTGEQKGVDVRLGLDLAAHGRNRVVDVMYLVSGDDDLTEAVEEAQGHGVEVVVMAVPGPNERPHAVSKHLLREADGILLIDGATVDAAVHKPIPRPKEDVEPPQGAAPSATNGQGRALALPPAATVPPKPSPADLARARVAVPPLPPLPAPTSSLAYSTSTGDPHGHPLGADPTSDLEAIDDVCRKVLQTWRLQATGAAQKNLLAGRPLIPGDIDRALLQDLSAATGVYDIDEGTRLRLREHFWGVVDTTM